MVTAAQVETALTDGTAEYKHWKSDEWEAGFRVDEDGWTEVDGMRITIDGEQYVLKVVNTTGGMDNGSHASVTFQVGEQYFRKEGYYASHYGYDWDGDFKEVRPVEKTVIVYE